MRRIAPVSIGVLLFLAAVTSSVSAGGANWLETDKRYVAPGQSVVASNRYFTRSDVAHAPYYLYLIREGYDWNAPLKAFAGAPVLGKARISWPEERARRGPMRHNPALTVRFTLPEVEPGRYALGLCDSPCEHRIGGVEFGSIEVVATPLEARLRPRIDDLQFRMSNLRHRIGSARRSQQKLARKLEHAISVAGAAASRSSKELGERVAGLRSEASGVSDSAHRANLVAAGALLLAALTLLLTRRGRAQATAPHAGPHGSSIEEELEQIEVSLEEPVLSGSGGRRS